MHKLNIFFIAFFFGAFVTSGITQYTVQQPWYIQVVGILFIGLLYFIIATYCCSIHKSKDSKGDFIKECLEKGWSLDHDDIEHIMNGDFDYVRKANTEDKK